MAQLTQRRAENISGNFYVDRTCIDCDTCRWMAPTVFKRADEKSAVYHQPASEQEQLEAMQALLACPTASIGTQEKPREIREVQKSFPLPVADNVYHCGYHSENSFGATTYLIERSQGNILIDSPRFSPPLVKRLEEMGGVRYLYLTHIDDVADHQKFRDHFGCDRILHKDDISAGTQGVEMQLSGTDSIELDSDVSIIPVPGHTKGHTVLLYKQKFLFSGDHLAWSSSLKHLQAFRRYCFYSWSEQIRSMEKLSQYEFEWVLPGHGRRHHAEKETMASQLQDCIALMKSQ